jgi:hypothetical protein
MSVRRIIWGSSIVIVSLALILVSAGCSTSQTKKPSRIGGLPKPKTVQTNQTARYHYKDVAEMVNGSESGAPGSDLIIQGVITEVQPSYEQPAPVIIKGEQAAEEFRIDNPGVSYVIVGENISDEELQAMQKQVEKNRFIRTVSVVTVSKVLKGDDTTNQVKVSEPGGQVGDRLVIFEGHDLLKLNEEVLLFLRKNDAKGYEDEYIIVGVEDGKYKIDKDKDEAVNMDTTKSKKFSDLEKEIADILGKQ